MVPFEAVLFITNGGFHDVTMTMPQSAEMRIFLDTERLIVSFLKSCSSGLTSFGGGTI
jgi:hypothetical protein